MSDHVDVLTLEDGQDFVSNIFRFRKGSKIRFVIGSSLKGKKIQLLTNCPQINEKDGQRIVPQFERNRFYRLKWKHKKESKLLFADLTLQVEGSFRYYFTDEVTSDQIIGSGFTLVQPEIVLPDGNTCIPIDTIGGAYLDTRTQLVTDFDSWQETLESLSSLNCNLIHLTPVQQCGQKLQSIEDHFTLSKHICPNRNLMEFKSLVDSVRGETNLVFMTDVILTSVAKSSPWIHKHPEAVVNLINSPHLRPAYLLDRVLRYLTLDILKGKFNGIGLTKDIHNLNQLNKLHVLLKETYLREARIYDLFLIDVDTMVKEYKDGLQKAVSTLNGKSKPEPIECVQVEIIQDSKYRRRASKVNLTSFVQQTLANLESKPDPKSGWLETCGAQLKEQLEQVNYKIMNDCIQQLNEATDNVIDHIRKTRIESGLKKPLSKDDPLVPSYFVHPGKEVDLKTDEKLMQDDKVSEQIMAYSGQLAEKEKPLDDDDEEAKEELTVSTVPAYNHYFKRQLKVDTGSVRLCLDSNGSYIKDYLNAYIMQTVDTFDAIALRDLMSCPVDSLVPFVDLARKLKPNLYIVGQLGRQPSLDENIYVNMLGLNGVIRTSCDCRTIEELGKLIRHTEPEQYTSANHRLHIAPCILYDCQPDNTTTHGVTEVHKFSLTAVTAMARSAICLLNEKSKSLTMTEVRKYLYNLHLYLSKGFTEVYVDVVDSNVIAVSRHNPTIHKSVVLISRTGFDSNAGQQSTDEIDHFLTVPGRINRILFEVEVKETSKGLTFGLKYEHPLKETSMVSSSKVDGENHVEFLNFKTGSVLVLDVSVHFPTKRKSSDVSENVAQQMKLDP